MRAHIQSAQILEPGLNYPPDTPNFVSMFEDSDEDGDALKFLFAHLQQVRACIGSSGRTIFGV